MKQYLEHLMDDTREGSERQGRFMEAIEAIEGSSKLAALDRAYHKALDLDISKDQDTYALNSLVDELTASIIYVRDLLASERT